MKTEQDLASCLDRLNQLCRICLCDNVNFDVGEKNNKWKDLYKQTIISFGIEIIENDVYPSEVCVECSHELNIANELRIKCENSNLVLNNVYKEYFYNEDKHKPDKTEKCIDGEYIDDNLPVYDSDDEPLANNLLEDDKDKLNNVILRVQLSGGKDKQKCITSSKKHKRSKQKNVSTKENGKKTNDLDSVVKAEIVDDISCDFDLDESGIVKLGNDEEVFGCNFCHKVLKDKRSIARHIAVQHGEEKSKEMPFKLVGFGKDRRFHCPDCPYNSKRKTDIKIHSRVHSGHRPYVCDICQKTFTQYGSLSSHKRMHFDTKYFTCQTCGKQFKYRETFKTHQLVHSNEYKFPCKMCNRSFKCEKNLNQHIKRHYRIMNHSCELCGSAFITLAELIKHKYIHQKKSKQFFCDHCDYSTHWKHTMKIHVRRHLKDKTEQCDQCDYSCYTAVELKLHKRKHSKEQKYSCPLCDEKFKQSSSVNKHMLRKHGQKFTWRNVADRRIIRTTNVSPVLTIESSL